jgi:DeoR/GlpR family transcriptional regulator of sugar metabolism
MRTEQRRREILRQLYLTGYVPAKELATGLRVNVSTIRRDLEVLARDGHLQRTHGGARICSGGVDVPYAVKQRRNLAAKRAIGSAACAFVRDGDRVILDSGSTTYQLAVELRKRQDLTIITNDLVIGQMVADYTGVRLLMTGGELLSTTYSLVGATALMLIKEIRVDWTFLSADAIDAEIGLTNTNTLEIALKQAMLAAARRVIVLVDSSKFGPPALVHVADIDEVDIILTDDQLDESKVAAYGGRLQRVSVPAPVGVRRLIDLPNGPNAAEERDLA